MAWYSTADLASYKISTRHVTRIYAISVTAALIIVLTLVNLRTTHPERRYGKLLTDDPLIMAPPRGNPTSVLEEELRPPDEPVSSLSDGLGGCNSLSGQDDVLVMLKTGATEIHKKLPVHFETTFRCVKNYLVFSDRSQEFEDLYIHDAVDQIEDFVDKDRSEWKFYQEINKIPHKNASELATMNTDDAWALDKFKNYPMLRKSYRMYPDKKWYMTMDADTAIMWPSLLEWLKRFDHTQILFIGAPSYINNVEFAHGGSGYILSQAAAKMLFEESNEDREKHLRFAMETCCGDFLMANALSDHQVELFKSWPTIQGDNPTTVDFSDNHWCFPTVTWHHVNPQQVKELWDFQQLSLANGSFPTFENIFDHFIWPNLTKEQDNWDNMSSDEVLNGMEKDEKDEDRQKEVVPARERHAMSTYGGCRKACTDMGDCLQFNWKEGECRLSKRIILGEKKDGIRSSWLLERIEKWKVEKQRHNCKPNWIDPTHVPVWE